MIVYSPESARVHIKAWLDKEAYFNDTALVEQVERVASLPFIFHHVALAPDAHIGYGLPIGGIAACLDVVVPYFVGSDISCGMRFVKTNIKVADVTKETITKLIDAIKKVIPVGTNWHKEKTLSCNMPSARLGYISGREYEKSWYYIGTLGSGNHFWEVQASDDGYLCIMLHSGSRNLGKQICDHYHKVAQELNAKWYSTVPKELAFLPLGTDAAQAYLADMHYAMAFAEASRKLMMLRTKEVIAEEFPSAEFEDDLDVNHNYARIENHFGKNVLVHRKGATSAREGELGIIPGSQGSSSYIVRGKGNPDSFMSCSHGAGRVMGREEAKRTLDCYAEVKALEDKGIVHSLTSEKKLDEAISCYKNIDEVMANQMDLVDIVSRMEPLGCIKG